MFLKLHRLDKSLFVCNEDKNSWQIRLESVEVSRNAYFYEVKYFIKRLNLKYTRKLIKNEIQVEIIYEIQLINSNRYNIKANLNITLICCLRLR